MTAKRPVPKFHVLTDTTLQTRYTHAELAQCAIDGGADGIQFRQKTGTTVQLLREAEAVRKVCDREHVTFIVNDRLDIALAVDADGLHIGQEDLPVRIGRRLLGAEKLLGVSAHTPRLGLRAWVDGADYIGFGPVFGTQSKDVGRGATGIECLRAFVEHVAIPVIAIGGVTADRAPELIGAGSYGVAVISAVCCANDVTEAARQFAVALGLDGRRSNRSAR
jgi:thiamine-phosphate pyrophosphorylase